jgi:hypothetical protein
MMISHTGRIGIGTESPDTPLHIMGKRQRGINADAPYNFQILDGENVTKWYYNVGDIGLFIQRGIIADAIICRN